MKTLKDTMPAMHKEICQRMSPDELLEGENIPVVEGVTIVLKDAKRRPVEAGCLVVLDDSCVN